MVSFPKLPTGVVTTPFRWAGCDANNVYHKQNRKTAAFVATLGLAWVGYNRFLATRIPLSTLATRAIVLGGTAGSIAWNNLSIRKDVNSWSAAETKFLAKEEDGETVLDTDALNATLKSIVKQLDHRASKWSGTVELPAITEPLTKQVAGLTREALKCAMRRQTTLIGGMWTWTKKYLITPKNAVDGVASLVDTSVIKVGERTNKVLVDAMKIAQDARKLALIEIFVADITKDESSPKTTPRLRTAAEARTYVQQLGETGRKRLEDLLLAGYQVYSMARGVACQRSEEDTTEEKEGYAFDWNSLENANLWSMEDPAAHRAELKTQYGLYLESVKTLQFVQSPLAESYHPVQDTDKSGFAPIAYSHLPPKASVLIKAEDQKVQEGESDKEVEEL